MKKRFPKLPPSPPASMSSTQASMRGNISKNTVPERKLAALLDTRDLTGYIANDHRLPGSPDIVFPDDRVAVFVNGCYWHRCPYCSPNVPKTNQDYWSAKFQRNKLRDAENRSELRAAGWSPVVIWECVLSKSPGRVAARIRRKLELARG